MIALAPWLLAASTAAPPPPAPFLERLAREGARSQARTASPESEEELRALGDVQ